MNLGGKTTMGKIKTLQKLKHQKSQHFKEEKVQLTCKISYFEGQGRHRMKVGQEKKKETPITDFQHQARNKKKRNTAQAIK